jgi:hypothetical protein
MEVQSHTFTIFRRFGITHSIFVIVIDVVIRDESMTVSLHPSGYGENKAHIEGKIYARTAVSTQIKRMCKLFLSSTANTNGMTCNATYSIKNVCEKKKKL